jgi:branched-chain amino acid transport system permease protein
MINKRITQVLKVSFQAALIAAVIFIPITGLVLKNYHVEPHWLRPLSLIILVFAGRFLFAWLESHPNTEITKLMHRRSVHVLVGENTKLDRLFTIIGLLIAIIIPFFASNYWLTICILSMIYILLGLGLNIVVGLAGLLDLGYVAFYAVGAYTYALGNYYFGLNFWEALPVAALLAGSFGCILAFPVLRMHGDYLAIVTLGFGEIIRLILNNWTNFTGGPNGMSIPSMTFFGLEFSRVAKQGGTPFHEFFKIPYSRSYQYILIYVVLLLVVCAVIYIAQRLKKMPLGRSWEALREDEVACRALGINHVTTKLSAFVMGATTGGLGGVFFAAYQGFVNPASFTFIESALILAIVVLGGMGSVIGVILAAIFITISPELLRDFASTRMLFFGLLMVVMVIWRPRGLIRLRREPFRRLNV